MRRFIVFLVVVILSLYGLAFSQNNATESGPSDPYKPTLDRLESLSRQPESEWRYHSDVPHPEGQATST